MTTNEDYELIDRYLLNKLSDIDKSHFINRTEDELFRMEAHELINIKKAILASSRTDLKKKLDIIHEETDKSRNPRNQIYTILKYGMAASFFLALELTYQFAFMSKSDAYSSHSGGAGIISKTHSNLAK